MLPEGEQGELVFTSLTKEAMPVIRYRTRDLTRLLPGTARSMRRMEKITGRSDDMMIVRGVNVFPTQIEELILKDERLAPHFVIELRREDRLDTMTVKVESRAGADDAGARGLQQGSRAPDQVADRRDRDGGHDCRPARSSARSARRSGSSICGGRASNELGLIPPRLRGGCEPREWRARVARLCFGGENPTPARSLADPPPAGEG